MADGRKKNGGHSTKGKAGRKPKVEEQKLIEKLTPLVSDAYNALGNALRDEQGWAVKLFFEYMYGKPKQQIEQTNTHNLNNFDIKDIFKVDNNKPEI